MWILHPDTETSTEIINMQQNCSNKHYTQLSNRAALYKQS